MLAEGVGEKLKRLPDMPECFVVLSKPGHGMSTAKVFGALEIDKIERHPDTEYIISAIENKDVCGIAQGMYNVLEEVVSAQRSDIAQIEKIMRDGGALGAMMSGSGSTTFGLFDDESTANAVYRKLKSRHRETFLAKTCSF